MPRKLDNQQKRLSSPKKNEPWFFLTVAMVNSPPWRALSINGRRLLDFLMIEHRAHGGYENGNLMATYDQLVDFGLTRSRINDAIDEVEILGFVDCDRGGKLHITNRPNTFLLTFYHDKDWNAATNRWKAVTQEEIDAWRATPRARNFVSPTRSPKQQSLPTSDTTEVSPVALPNGSADSASPPATPRIRQSRPRVGSVKSDRERARRNMIPHHPIQSHQRLPTT